MSLAMFAAPFDENINSESDNLINKKRQTHNKTQKKYYPKENSETNQSFNKEKVNSVLEKIHNNPGSDDDEDEKHGMGDFNPPPMPHSAGVNKTIATEQMSNMSNQNNELIFRTLGRAPQPNYEGEQGTNLDLNDYSNYGDSKTVEEYYKKILPGYNGQNNNQFRNLYNKPYYNNNQSLVETSGQDVLLQKLNYMINLLEEQQDERTNNVTEEVVLYSFLGIFIIFVVDSFARVGKYVR
jgi:hypothetical protein